MPLNPQSAAGSHTVRRSGLLERLAVGRARIISLVAPAGFGKSTAALQLADEAKPVVFCDCADVTDEIDLAARILSALGDTGDKSARLRIEAQVTLHTAAVSIDERLAAVVLAWRNFDNPATLIVENAEGLRSSGATQFFSRLLQNTPSARRIIICSRRPLPIQLGRFAAPEFFATLHATDLAFTRSELAEVFAHTVVREDLIERAASISQGWPVIATLLAQFASEGRLESVLDDVDEVAFEDLRAYLAAEILSSLDDVVATGLTVCAFVPKARKSDVASVLQSDAAMHAFQRYVRSSPFVSTLNECYELHPLVRTTIVERYADRKNSIVRIVATAAERSGDDLRAAQLYIIAGDQESAAAALDRIDWIERPSPDVEQTQVLAALERAVIRRYPRLWAVTIFHGRFSGDPHLALGEAHALLRTMDSATPVSIRSYVVRPLAGFLSRLGMHEAGYRMIVDFESETHVSHVPQSFDQAAVVYIRMMIAGRLGRLAEFREQAARAWPYASKSDAMSTLFLVERAAEVERAEGRRQAERASLEEALLRGRRSGVASNVAFAIAEATMGAWLAGEEDAYRRLLDDLEVTVHRDGVRSFAFFVDCARGRYDRQPTGRDLPKWIVCAHLLACTLADDPGERERHAVAAADAAIQYGAPFMETLAFLARAENVIESRRESLESAIRSARRVESERLNSAVAAFIAGEPHCGMLDAFARQLRARQSAGDELRIDVLSGAVRLGGRPVALSGRQLELTIALAGRRSPRSRHALQELLWPGVDEAAAQNAFNICLHHVRRRLGDAIVRSADGYSLGGATCVDLWEIEDALAQSRPRSRLNDFERTRLSSAYEKLCEPRSNRTAGWVWFEAHERHMAELRYEIGEILGRDAFAAGDANLAIELGRAIVAYDPCDEPARILIIKSLLSAGDLASAKREYRRYIAVLAEQLQAAPTFAFEDLVANERLLLDRTTPQNTEARHRLL